MLFSKLALVIVSLAGVCLGAMKEREIQKSPFPGFRLLRVSESKPAFWVPQEVVEELSSTSLEFVDITDFQDADSSLAPQVENLPSAPTHQSVVNPLLPQLNGDLFESNLRTFSSFRNRYYTSDYGVQSADWLFAKVQEASRNRSDVTISKFPHSFKQPSVIAKLQGISSAKDIVILGAHQDSTAPSMPSGSAPGADDDGTGSMGILEIFRVLCAAGFRPQKTIEFHWYAAEEVGLLGSQGVAKDYQARGVSVRSMMQLDMIGYDVKESTVGLVTDYVDPDTVQFARVLTDEYLQIGWTNTVCGYGCSDHASWNRYGYRSCFPFEAQFRNRNPLIHTTGDTMATVSVKHALEFMKLGLSFAVELSYN